MMDRISADARARVAKGAALLDQQRPGWAAEIDVQQLQMDHACGCILGQLFVDFSIGVRRLLRDSYLDAAPHGFERREMPRQPSLESLILLCEADYDALQDAWIEAIAARVIEPALSVDANDRRVGA